MRKRTAAKDKFLLITELYLVIAFTGQPLKPERLPAIHVLQPVHLVWSIRDLYEPFTLTIVIAPAGQLLTHNLQPIQVFWLDCQVAIPNQAGFPSLSLKL